MCCVVVRIARGAAALKTSTCKPQSLSLAGQSDKRCVATQQSHDHKVWGVGGEMDGRKVCHVRSRPAPHRREALVTIIGESLIDT